MQVTSLSLINGFIVDWEPHLYLGGLKPCRQVVTGNSFTLFGDRLQNKSEYVLSVS